ncbi:hypothetical protein KR222_011584 [Zaprionus bogoriensis]|nr:hypothetical protein KR222_011584 [Zaprionus bogoriensis]
MQSEENTQEEEFNADELNAPEWLNAQFFAEVLRKHEKTPDLNVVDVQISPASGKGDHYASVMFRGNVSYTTSKGHFTKSLIVKTMPEQEGHKKEMLSDSYLFATEIGMYIKVLPKFEEILRQAGDNTRLCVPCIYHSMEPRQLMVFEDLLPQGYVVIRNREATVEEVKAALTKLGKWHAVSIHVLHENPEFLKEFTHGIFDMPNFMDDPIMKNGMRLFIDFLDLHPKLSKYKPFFESIESDYLQRYKEIILEYFENRQPNGYYVLCHGDFHLRNMMFKHNKINGSLEDCNLLDFQISYLCPMTLDLIYASYLVLGPEERHNMHDELIEFYFNEVLKTLKTIGFKGEFPKLSEFLKQIARHKYYEFFLIATFLPLIYGMKSNSIDFAEFAKNEDVRRKLYSVDGFLEDIEQILAKFERLGYFK